MVEQNRSPLVRVPARRDSATGVELRVPDTFLQSLPRWPSRSARDSKASIRTSTLAPPITQNIHKMSFRERRHLRIDELPANLSDALDALEKDEVVQAALGRHIYEHFLEGQAQRVARSTIERVRRLWKLARYLSV